MKFMVTWQFHPGKLGEALQVFSKMTAEDDARNYGNVKPIGRWHDVTRGRGVAIVEAESAADLAHWALHWNGMLDLEVTPVLDDEETRQVGREQAQQSSI